MIINPGSQNKGGTFDQALKNAQKWHENIKKEFPEVVMTTEENRAQDGDWKFTFTHKITGKSVDMEIHGFTDKECDNFTFCPRTYWNGSSSGEPQISDWLSDGFKYRIEYYRH